MRPIRFSIWIMRKTDLGQTTVLECSGGTGPQIATRQVLQVLEFILSLLQEAVNCLSCHLPLLVQHPTWTHRQLWSMYVSLGKMRKRQHTFIKEMQLLSGVWELRENADQWDCGFQWTLCGSCPLREYQEGESSCEWRPLGGDGSAHSWVSADDGQIACSQCRKALEGGQIHVGWWNR